MSTTKSPAVPTKPESRYAQEQLTDMGLSGPVEGAIVQWEMALKILSPTATIHSLPSAHSYSYNVPAVSTNVFMCTAWSVNSMLATQPVTA